jgi:polyisoprenyl-teichoic acid--peptidoglycan teichoic acid transferase
VVTDPVVVRPPRVWPRRLLIGLNIFVALALLATATGYLFIRNKLGNFGRTDLCEVLRNCGDDDPGKPMNVLLVGSDTRATLTPEEQKRFGTERAVGGQRSDTMLVLHVDPKAEKAAILSIPRDLYVPIAGTNSQDRINSAFDKGPEGLIQTITQALGIQIDHYAEVDFAGFQDIVDAIGPINVYFPGPARDNFSGLHQKTPGCIPLHGEAALAYVRSRNFEYYEGGRWHSDPTADLGRIQRQQDFIRRLMRTAIRNGARNPLKLNSLIDKSADAVTLDKSFSTKDIYRVANRFRSLEPDSVDMLTIPTTPASIGGKAVLRLKMPEAQEILDRFSGRPQPTSTTVAPGAIPNIPPSSVRVRVLNGTGTGGQAGEVSGELSKAGFVVSGTGDADTFKYIQPVIRYGRGQRDKAVLLQAYVQGGAQLREDLTIRGIDLVLVTGAQYQGIRNPRGGAQAATTTTAPPAANNTTTTKPSASGAQPKQTEC